MGKAFARMRDVWDTDVDGRLKSEGEKENGKTPGRRKEKSRRLGLRVVIIACACWMTDIERGGG